MNSLVTKHLDSDLGDVVYDVYRNPEATEVNLFIHGLGYNRFWFSDHLETYDLKRYSWIIPDLIGHGDSVKPDDTSAYSMENQAECLYDILLQEEVHRVRIIAHSMGGPIAISLLELLETNEEVVATLLLYLEGNLDEGDAFFSSKVASMPFQEYAQKFESWCQSTLEQTEDESMRSWIQGIKQAGPLTIWASSKDLVAVSKTDNLLPRLFQAFDGPMYFIYGADNKGDYSSENLVRESGESIIYVPDAGHAMHEDNPTGFWDLVTQLIEKHS